MGFLSLKEKPIEVLLKKLHGAAREKFLRRVANFITNLLADYHLDPSRIGFVAEPLERVEDFLLGHCHGISWVECIDVIERLIKEHGGILDLDRRLDEVVSLMEKVEAAMKRIDTYCGMWDLPSDVCEELRKLEDDPCADEDVVEKVLGSYFRSEGATEEQYRPALEQIKSIIRNLAKERKCVRWDHLVQAVKSMSDLEKWRQRETARKIAITAITDLDRILRKHEEEMKVEKPVETVAPPPPPPERPPEKPPEKPTIGSIINTPEGDRVVKRIAMKIVQYLGLSRKEDIDLVVENAKELVARECPDLTEDECIEYTRPFIRQWWEKIKQRAREERRIVPEKPPEVRRTVDQILASPEAEGLIRRFGMRIARLLMLTRKEDIDYVVENTRKLLEDNCRGLIEEECFSYVRLFIAQWWEKLKQERRVKRAIEAIIRKGLAPPGFITMRIISMRLRRDGKILVPIYRRIEYIYAHEPTLDDIEAQLRSIGEIPTRSPSPCVDINDIASKLIIILFLDSAIELSDENTLCCVNCIMYYRDVNTNKVVIRYSMPIPKETRGWPPRVPAG